MIFGRRTKVSKSSDRYDGMIWESWADLPESNQLSLFDL